MTAMDRKTLEKLYVGLIGMDAGMRLGAPVENPFWTYERLQSYYGDIRGYLREQRYYTADDDVNGPLIFVRALADNAMPETLTSEAVGETWLNYTRRGMGMFWWGGEDASTEHRAYMNLRRGVKAPRSGSIGENGKTAAEQIGGQIFADAWGLICPGDPARASALAAAAASVSHDGSGVDGARFMAACIAAAYTASSLDEVLDTGLRFLPEKSDYRCVVETVRAYHRAHPAEADFRACRAMIAREFREEAYPGGYHIVPNAGICILAMLYGKGDLGRMSELQYGIIPQLEKEVEESTKAGAANGDGEMELVRDKVTDAEIAEVVSRATGIPVAKMLESEKSKLLHMEDELHKRVIGQDEAVDAISNAIRRSRAGLSDPNRPIGSFLFMGPTGVGKTELSKAVASFLFDTEKAMVRIDMSEFMEKHTVSRLVGAPPGYVGYEQGGYLTEAVRRRPYSVILLDEIEKAHPDVFNILLQVLDDGRLTDGQGRTVDFKNTVIIMTSNLGSQMIQEDAGRSSYSDLKAKLLKVLEQHFRPEFLNRIDETVVFHPLSIENIKAIARIHLRTLEERMKQSGYDVEISDEIANHVAKVGFDPLFGARPLRRVIQNEIADPLSKLLLEGQVIPGTAYSLGCGPDGKLILDAKGPSETRKVIEQ